MGDLRSDIRFGARSLIRDRWFTLGAAAIVVLAVGVNAVVFSSLNTAFLRPLPYPDAHRIVAVWELDRGGHQMQAAWPNTVDWQREAKSVDALAVFGAGEVPLDDSGDPEYVGVASVGQQFLRVLGVNPIAGRWIAADEARPGAPLVAVISEGLWRRRFGARSGIVGTSIRLGPLAATVVGVLPRSATYPRGVDVWISAEWSGPTSARTAHNWSVVARLRPGVSVSAAEAELSAITGRLMASFPSTDAYAARAVRLVPLREALLGSSARLLWLLQGAVLLVLGIATVNLTNLMLVRATRQRAEVAVRAALGADRARLVRRFVVEAVMLTGGSGLLGVVAAVPLRSVLHAVVSRFLPELPAPEIDARVVVVSLVAAIVVGVVAALVPAVRASREDPSQVLGSGASLRVVGHHPLMRVLIGCQVALALMLLVGAGLLVQSLSRLGRVAPGFVSEGKVSMRVAGGFNGLDAPPEAQVAAVDRLLQAVAMTPGTSAVTVAGTMPLRDVSSNASLELGGADRAPDGSQISADFRVVGPAYFSVMGIPLLSGRDFESSDQLTSPRMVIINQAFVARYLTGQNPVGQRLRFRGLQADAEPWGTVIAVVGNVHHRSLELPAEPEVYYSYRQRPFGWRDFSVVASSKASGADALTSLRAVLRSQYPAVPFRGQTLDEISASVVAVPRVRTVMLSLFAALAIGLAATGILSVVAFAVAERTREIGVRIALGASRATVTRATMRWAMRPIWIGLVVGGAGAWAGGRLVQSFLFDTRGQDPAVFVAAVVGMAAVGAVASYLPARRASRIDPSAALRSE